MNARGGIYICMHVFKTDQGIRSGGGGGGGGTQFPSELSSVNWFCTTRDRELGPGDRIP